VKRPNILFLMTDQQRFDTIAALGNRDIYTPHLDRLVARGLAFTNAYSTCPVCVPARYTVMSGYEPPTTGVWKNMTYPAMHQTIEERCGPFLPATLAASGYRTFGVGKFHTIPWDAPLGFETQLHSEELYADADARARDAYASFIANEHPEYDWVEMLMGERTEMYYIPQMSPLPAELTVEAWGADRAVELINASDTRPWFGFVSFVGPHPPLAPPQPFNRLNDPDRMPPPQRGEPAIDRADQQIPLMNHMIWADDISDGLARIIKARYYGEITYIDDCLGRILDVVEARDDAENTLICFFSDHGDHLGDHNGWQKESYFEPSAHVPLLVSWPDRIAVDASSELVCLTDLFGLATSAAGDRQLREGTDLLGHLTKAEPPRETLTGCYGEPGKHDFKFMVRQKRWKLIYLANGGTTQLFNLDTDPHELDDASERDHKQVAELLTAGGVWLSQHGCDAALDGDQPLALPYKDWREQLKESRVETERAAREAGLEATPFSDSGRLFQFDLSRGIKGFPKQPADLLRATRSSDAPVANAGRMRDSAPTS
jgi:choline-sulfatase